MAGVSLDGGLPVQVMVDTGATGALALSEPVAAAVGLLGAGQAVSQTPSVSLGGVSLDRVVRVRKAAFGVLTFPDVPVQIYVPGKGAPGPPGLLGTGLLGRFVVALDLASGKLWLTPPALLITPFPD